MIVNIESKDGGFYSTNTDLTLHYYDGDLSHATVSSPTLLSFKVPDKYEDGVVVFSGAELNKLINFSAGGVATPADAALMMQLGAEGVFVGSGIFKSGNPEKRAAAIVKAVTNYNNPAVLAELSEDLGEAMIGINPDEIKVIMESR